MSLNIVSRIALAFGALTIATLPAFAETAATITVPASAVASPAVANAQAGNPTTKHHVRKTTLHHKKAAKKGAVEKTGLTTAKPASPAAGGASAASRL